MSLLEPKFKNLHNDCKKYFKLAQITNDKFIIKYMLLKIKIYEKINQRLEAYKDSKLMNKYYLKNSNVFTDS